MGKSTISMAIFNCYVCSPEGNHQQKKAPQFGIQADWTASVQSEECMMHPAQSGRAQIDWTGHRHSRNKTWRVESTIKHRSQLGS